MPLGRSVGCMAPADGPWGPLCDHELVTGFLPRALPSAGAPSALAVRCFSVLCLAVAILVMHTMGMGHPAESSSPMTSMSATASGSVAPVLLAAEAAPTVCDHDCADPSHPMDIMGGQMCLAVLTFATLFLLGLGRGTRARDLALSCPRAWRGLPLSGRATPSHLTPSLSRLCVLRT